MKQHILPAISNFKALEYFLESDLEYCVVMNFPLTRLYSVCRMIHEQNKKVIVHIDLINGLSSDEHGAEFLVEVYRVDGLISTRPTVIKMGKKKGVISIQRIFIIDSHSLKKSIQLATQCEPDYIEILPGYSYSVLAKIRESLDTPLIGGGLIDSEEMVRKCLEHGLESVTTSEHSLWNIQ